ncbi:Gfo/Idh/MocA family protein [Portibacter lacus]|uniref:Oxidoreductase n=1 Tax=Portibacter lacus TaxID=1099794 RepID=A0AA37SP44_9BACT|nr:Gfo/Idh/MocA family oxidoreductase [Portibacter lacus]GLR17387.1 oxidoreductase [Portibacter lacus]
MKNSLFNNQSRRTFVKSSALIAGGVALNPLNISARSYISGDDAIKVGLIGCGGRGTGAAFQALATEQNVKLVAVADAFQDNAEKCVKNIKKSLESEEMDVARLAVTNETIFSGFDAYKKVIAMSDVVIIATSPGFRPIHFEAAINANKHVFMEKPVATDANGVRKVLEMAEVAKAKKLNVVVGLQRHYQAKYIDWVNAMHEGAIGDIVSSRVYWNSAGVWVRERKPGQTEMEYQMRNWYYFNWLCGDHITEQHIHNLDVGNWVKKAYPIKAYGMGGREIRHGKDHGQIFDHHDVQFEYADGSMMFSQCRHQPGCDNRVTEMFQGTNGSAPSPGVLKSKTGEVIKDFNKRNAPNPYQVEHDLLFAAVANGDYKYADAENGAKSTMTSLLGRAASYSGKEVSWDDALNSTKSLMPTKYSFDADPPVMPDENGNYPVPIPGITEVL